MKLSIIATACALASVAAAQEVTISRELPIKISRASVGQQSGLTVVTVTIENTGPYIRSMTISCEARNAEGNTWDVVGTTRNYDPGEKRTSRLVSETEQPQGGVVSAKCVVNQFDGAAPL